MSCKQTLSEVYNENKNCASECGCNTSFLTPQGKAVSNFTETLPSPQSDLVQQTLKDPYIFDFLTLHAEAIERDLESGLVDHIEASGRCPIHWSRTLQNTRPNHGRIRAARYCQTDRGRPVANQVRRFVTRTAKEYLTKHRGNRSRIRASCNRLSRGHSNKPLGDELETMNDMLIQDTSK